MTERSWFLPQMAIALIPDPFLLLTGAALHSSDLEKSEFEVRLSQSKSIHFVLTEQQKSNFVTTQLQRLRLAIKDGTLQSRSIGKGYRVKRTDLEGRWLNQVFLTFI